MVKIVLLQKARAMGGCVLCSKPRPRRANGKYELDNFCAACWGVIATQDARHGLIYNIMDGLESAEISGALFALLSEAGGLATPKKTEGCTCGALKTVGALKGSPMHSNWCDWRS